MKNLLYIVTLFLIFSCSSSDDSSKDTTNGDFHPPTWIQGTYKQEGSTATIGLGFKFSSEDFCVQLMGGTEQCQQGMISLIRQGGGTATVEESISDTTYSAKMNTPGGQSTTYSFKKVSNTVIEYIGVKFIKQ